MNIKKVLKGLTIIPTLLIFSCNSQKAGIIEDRKEVKKVFDRENFDESIINALPYYDSLKNLILTNKDTIFKYRDVKTSGHSYNEKGEDSASPVIWESYNFIYHTGRGESSDDISLSTIPATILDPIENICKYLGPLRLVGFDLDRHDSSFMIIVKNLYDEKADVETQHTMQWNWDYTNQKVEFLKDSILRAKWIYYITSEKRHGM
jgi:hypothetical protein